ncbi:MAG: hypothetical protein ACXU7D_11240, partial [Burkholderiaceae bacterium]
HNDAPFAKRCALAAALFLVALVATILSGCAASGNDVRVAGIVWQIDNATLDPRGSWERIGATEMLVQWTAVDGTAFVPGADMPTAPRLPDWQRIAGEPWAQQVILGLAGSFDENTARSNIANLTAASEKLAKLPTPLHVAGWYFPVEIDPTWAEAANLGPLLASLPRPLWISVYDSANVGPDILVEGLMKWLPPDVGVFFQDGVGVHAREAKVARHYADVLSARLGKERVRIVVEAFRPKIGGGFRSATLRELKPQLREYDGYRLYVFDGPHYLTEALTTQLAGDRR